MAFIEIKAVRQALGESAQSDFDPNANSLPVVYAVPAVAINTPGGAVLIPNPAGQQTFTFSTLEEAEHAVERAGFDSIFEGRKRMNIGHGNALSSSSKTQPAMGQFKHPLGDSIPLLIKQLQESEPAVIAAAALALGELGELIPDYASTLAQALIAVLGHQDGTVRKNAADAITKLGSEGIPHLMEAYRKAQRSYDKNAPYIRMSVMMAYRGLCANQPQYLDQLLLQVNDALADENWLVRSQAAQVVAETARYMNQKKADPA